MKLFKFKSLATKLMTFFGLLLIVTFIGVNIIFVRNLKSALLVEKKSMTKNLVQSYIGTIDYFYKMEKSGTATRDQAQDLAKNALRAGVFGERKKDYFFIHDMEPKMIMHPFSPQLVGTNIASIADADGSYLFRNIVDMVRREGKGFIQYKWQYYDEKGRDELKISYVEEFEPWGWVVGTGVYINDIQETASAILRRNLTVQAIFLVIVSIVLVVLLSGVRKTILQAVERIKDIATGEGDLTKRVEVTSNDEIGQMAGFVNQFIEKIHIIVRDIDQNTESVASSSTELNSIATLMNKNSESTVTKSATVSAAAEEMSSNMETIASASEQSTAKVNDVASGIEEISASIGEIAQNAAQSSEISRNAVAQSAAASKQVNALGAAAKEIGKVTETIAAISNQTNLLALNATIEAARAGEAGKGFAVVANEIKELAKQTAEATEDITGKLKGVQNSADDTVRVIEEIAKVIGQVDDMVSSIAAAVEQQNATSSENAKNVAEVAAGLREVSENVGQTSMAASQIAEEITDVNEAANEMSNSAAQVQQSSSELSQISERLQSIVKQFKI